MSRKFFLSRLDPALVTLWGDLRILRGVWADTDDVATAVRLRLIMLSRVREIVERKHQVRGVT